MKKITNIAAAVLAGGKNSRMSGCNKAFIRINGTFIIQRTMNLLKGIFEEVILVTNSPQDYKLYQKEALIITDTIKDAGPLGGIHSALSVTEKRGVFFVACDMPFLHNDIILRQIDFFNKINCDCLAPRINSFIEPLHTVYKKGLEDKISVYLKDNSNYSVRNFLKTLEVCYFDLEDTPFYRNIFKNLNSPEDFKEATKYYASEIESLA